MMRGLAGPGVMLAGLLLLVPAAQGKPPAAAPDSTRSLRCWELGNLFGSAFMKLDDRLRARGPVLEAYCSGQVDSTLRRVPTAQDVALVEQEIRAVLKPQPGAGAKINTSPLDQQLRQGAQSEQDMLNQLLK
jgi:hypothetical protein